MTRLFVALWPPADVVSTLAALPRPNVPGVRWSAPDQWMVKVRPFGRVADRLVEPLVTALADALDGAPAIECAVGPATRRLGGQWLGAPVNGLDDLAVAVFEATAEIVPVTCGLTETVAGEETRPIALTLIGTSFRVTTA